MDVINEILRWKELLDKGIITQEEFDYKKKQLINMHIEQVSEGKKSAEKTSVSDMPEQRTVIEKTQSVQQEKPQKRKSRIGLILIAIIGLLFFSAWVLAYFFNIQIRFAGWSLGKNEYEASTEYSYLNASELEEKISDILVSGGSQYITYEELYNLYEPCHEYNKAHPGNGLSENLMTEFSLLMLRGEWVDQDNESVLQYRADVDCAGLKVSDILTDPGTLPTVKSPDKAYYYYFDVDSMGELLVGYEEASSGEQIPNYRVVFYQDSISLYNYVDDRTITAYPNPDAKKFSICGHVVFTEGVCSFCGEYASVFIGTLMQEQFVNTEEVVDENGNTIYKSSFDVTDISGTIDEKIILEYYPDEGYVTSTISYSVPSLTSSVTVLFPASPTSVLTYNSYEYRPVYRDMTVNMSGQFDPNTIKNEIKVPYSEFSQSDGNTELLTNSEIFVANQINLMFDKLNEIFYYNHLPNYPMFYMNAWQSFE